MREIWLGSLRRCRTRLHQWTECSNTLHETANKMCVTVERGSLSRLL